jgi:antimicrobial peptide system SdpA family protein
VKTLQNILVYLIPLVLIGVVGFYSLISSLEFNPLSISQKKSKMIFTLVPQGWGFFTRDPREAQTLIYTKTSGGFELVNKSASEPEYLFGLSRMSRRKNIEFGYVFSQIPDSLWVDHSDIVICDSLRPYHIKNAYLNPVCRGEFVVVSKDPIPWAWSKSYYSVEMPFKCCKIYVD